MMEYTEKPSAMQRVFIFCVSSLALKSIQGFLFGALNSLIGPPCVVLMLALGIAYAPLRWKYPSSVNKIGTNYFFRWICYGAVLRTSIQLLMPLVIMRAAWWMRPKMMHSTEGWVPESNASQEFDHWYIRGEFSMLQPHIMNRTDLDPDSPTYGKWTPPPEWRDLCIKTGGSPMFACSYFAYEEHPAFMTAFYVLHYGFFIINQALSLIFSIFTSYKVMHSVLYHHHKGFSWIWSAKTWEDESPISMYAYWRTEEPISRTVWYIFSLFELYQVFGSGLGLVHSFGTGKLYFGAGWNHDPIPSIHDLHVQFPTWYMCFFVFVDFYPLRYSWLWGLKQLHWAAAMTGSIGPFPHDYMLYQSWRFFSHVSYQGSNVLLYVSKYSIKAAARAASGNVALWTAPENALSIKNWVIGQPVPLMWPLLMLRYLALWQLPAIRDANPGWSDDAVVTKWLSLTCCVHYFLTAFYVTMAIPFISGYFHPAVDMWIKSRGTRSPGMSKRLSNLWKNSLLSAGGYILQFGTINVLVPTGAFILMAGRRQYFTPNSLFPGNDLGSPIHLLALPLTNLINDTLMFPWALGSTIFLGGGIRKTFGLPPRKKGGGKCSPSKKVSARTGPDDL